MKALPTITFLLVIIIYFQFPCFAQSRSQNDSLRALITASTVDTVRMKLYGQLCWNYASTREKLDSAKMYADSIYYLAESMGEERMIAYAHFYYGTIARHLGNLAIGLSHFNKYVAYHEQHGNIHLVATGLYQVGVIMSSMGNYNESLTNLYRVLEIHETNDYKYGVGFTLNTIGIIQRKIKNYEDAIESFKNSIAIFSALDEQYDLAMSLENLGNVFGEMNNYDSAMHYYHMALDIDIKLDKKYGIASEHENIGNLYLKMGELENALEYQLRSYEIRKQLPQQRELAISMNRLGEIYMKLGQYKTSGDYLNDAMQLSIKTESKPEILFSFEQFANLHELQGNFAQANIYLKKVMELKDSILNEDKLKQINEVEIRYETSRKDQEIELLSKENEVKEARAQQQAIVRNALIGIIILIAILAFSVYYTLRQKLKNQRLISEKNEEIKLSNYKRKMTDLELKALRSQMNPHFIFNCMNSINRMILSGDGAEASKYLTKFAKLIRLTLEKSENNTVTLEDELSMLEAYIQLESIRFKGKINYSIAVDDSIDQSAISLPSMVLQPFIENAIWHGLMHKKEPGNIHIKINEEGDILKCSIEDDGVGREMALKLKGESEQKTKSMGLKITEERLRLICNDQLDEWIHINDLKDALNNPAGTRVNISIPIN